MARPALERLMTDVDAGRIDVVVVYKVDRLTRSLADFARIVERFDAKGVSFVSVTQAFNTTSSMGRLTLNVLLSFAQFEREVTGERIRDKIAMSKARGMWMGGTPPLGYDHRDRDLLINPAEAETVRAIYRRYLQIGSVHRLRDVLEAEGVRSKRWVRSDGEAMGGAAIGRGALLHILKNRLYLGEIVHKEKVHPGRHHALLERELFDQVQARLKANSVERGARPTARSASPLAGRVIDADGAAMSPSFAYGRHGRLYRYYVSTSLLTGAAAEANSDRTIRRVGAKALERRIAEVVGRLAGRAIQPEDLDSLVRRLELRCEETQLLLDAREVFGPEHPELAFAALEQRLAPGERAVWEGQDHAILRVQLSARMQLRGGRTQLTTSGEPVAAPTSSPTAGANLLKLLRSAHTVQQRHGASPLSGKLGEPRAPAASYHRNLGRLAFLAPDLQRAIPVGALPTRLSSEQLLGGELPLAWADQRRWLDLRRG